MAKKFVRGVTGIENVDQFKTTLTDVNDIISDGKDTYVHTKKDKTESYYKLTDSVKQVKSTDGLLTITKKDDTVSITNKGLATKEELKIAQNPLSAGAGLSINNNQITIKPKQTSSMPAENGIYIGNVAGDGGSSVGISLSIDTNKFLQFSFRESVSNSGRLVGKYRFITDGTPSSWHEMVIDSSQWQEKTTEEL